MKLFTSTCPKVYLKCESIHDDVVRHHSQRMNLSHENGSRYLVELDALQKVGHDVTQVNSAAEGVTGALRPVHRRLELGQLIGFQLFARENQSNHMLRKQGKRAQRENFISVLVYKLQHSLHQRLCALVLNVPLCWRQNRVDRVHGDAAGDETNARASQLFQTIVVSRIQQSYVCLSSEFLNYPLVGMHLPSRVLACSVTQPVWMYSISWRKTSGSNSSMIIVWWVCTVGCCWLKGSPLRMGSELRFRKSFSFVSPARDSLRFEDFFGGSSGGGAVFSCCCFCP